MSRFIATVMGAAVLAGWTASGGDLAYSEPPETASSAGAQPVLHLSQRGRPRGVARRRFVRVVRRAARYWRVRIGAPTRLIAGRRDGVNVVSFSRRLPERIGGQTMKATTLTGGRVVDREIDVRLNSRTPWADGPELPSRRQWDLATVLYHEFGHVVGARHTHRCRNSAMYHEGRPGEWWRGSGDWFRYGCRNAPGVF